MNESPRKETIVVFFENKEQEQHWDVHVSKSEKLCAWCRKEVHKGDECFRVKDGLMHIACLKFRESLRPAWWMAEKLGISTDQFKRLVKSWDLRSDNSYINRFNSAVQLWDPAIVERMKDTIGVIDARARLAKRQAKKAVQL